MNAKLIGLNAGVTPIRTKEAEKTWCRVNGPEQVKRLLEGIAFSYAFRNLNTCSRIPLPSPAGSPANP